MGKLASRLIIILHTGCLCLVSPIMCTQVYEPQKTGDVRLVNPTSTLPNPAAGRLEVQYNGTWGTVCDDGFTNVSAQVVCDSLGFGRRGSFIHNAFGPGSGPIWLDDVVCSGSETSIDQCRHSPWGVHNCHHSEDVCISCSGADPEYADGVRLVNSTSYYSNIGRLEVLYNGTWGTVCDDYFTNAAQVVCARLGFERNGSVIHNSFGYGTGKIWLDDVKCNGNEPDIANCSHLFWGSHNCVHQEDVAIVCDINECTSGHANCDTLSTICVNTFGSYVCSCLNGYISWNSTSCIDVDECVTGQSICDTATTSCVNTAGSYQCLCRNGYRPWNSTSCTDVDECEAGEILCDNSTTVCINNNGGYQCSCRYGYIRENDTECSDINECINGESECDLFTTDCINTIGSYKCNCKTGFAALNVTTCLGTSSHDSTGVIVGASVAAFLVVALAILLLSVLIWKRRKQVNQPKQTESPGSGNSRNSKVYENLDHTLDEMKENQTAYMQLSASTLLSVPPKNTKNSQSPSHVYENENHGNVKVYEALDRAASEMEEKEATYTQLNASSLLLVAPRKLQQKTPSHIYDNVK